ncbi:MAG TPA: hypothetical protein VIM16_15355 [Mucilaginibacter sp.]|jgi:hypothetical protein
MKKHVKKTGALIVTFLLSIQLVAAQKADTAMIHSSKTLYDLYMQRHKRLNTAGWVLLGSGAGMIIIGVVDLSSGDIFSSGFTTGALLFSLGSVAALVSIPCFIIAGSSERKAILQLKSGYVPGAYKFNYVGLALKINL